MYRIITIEREFGCGGGEIARVLAARLGWKLWDHALTEEIARAANVDCSIVERCEERVDSTFQRLVHVFLRGSQERSISLPSHEPFNTDRFVAVGKKVMERVANQGEGVIVGRGAPYFLRDHGEAFHVFLYASYAEKLRRVLELGKSRKEAEEQLETIDLDRMTFVKRYFDADWPTRCLYHMMINTAIGNENVISTILDTVHILENAAANAHPSLQSCEPGPSA
ncbi:MAG: cytidylate kinase-like family protein [Terriglobales bacterium]